MQLGLQREGFAVDIARDGESGLALALAAALVIADRDEARRLAGTDPEEEGLPESNISARPARRHRFRIAALRQRRSPRTQRSIERPRAKSHGSTARHEPCLRRRRTRNLRADALAPRHHQVLDRWSDRTPNGTLLDHMDRLATAIAATPMGNAIGAFADSIVQGVLPARDDTSDNSLNDDAAVILLRRRPTSRNVG